MSRINLSDEEAEVLRVVLGALAIKSRTRELGMVHGMNRFVSTNTSFKKEQHKTLDSVARKLGLSGIRLYDEGT